MLKTVLEEPSNSALPLALSHNGLHNIQDVMNMESDDIDIIDTGDPTKPMMRGHRNRLRAFKAFLHHLEPNVDYLTITYDDFYKFRWIYRPESKTPINSPSKKGAISSPSKKGATNKSDATEFNKGLHDPDDTHKASLLTSPCSSMSPSSFTISRSSAFSQYSIKKPIPTNRDLKKKELQLNTDNYY